MDKQYIIDIQNLHKTFKSGKITAINHLSLKIEKGQTIGLIGADGAGKTTLLRLINGLLLPDEGYISINGLNPWNDKKFFINKISYMPQKFALYEDLTIKENLDFYAKLKNIDKNFNNLLDFAGLTLFQNRLVGNLSGGMKQKLGLICALMGNPDLLLLDEPSVGVDPVSRRELLKMVKKTIHNNATVIWATAYMDEAHGFDRVIVIDKGKIIYQGKPYDLAPDTKKFEEKIIALMGGFSLQASEVAKNFIAKPHHHEYVVEADNLSKKYGEFYAVKNNSFKIKAGKIFGLLGPNGAGKSTSFKMMCGLIKPTSGTARIMGIDIIKNPSAARANIGYMAQKFSLYPNLSVQQNLNFFAGAYGLSKNKADDAIKNIIDIFAFKPFLNDNANDLPLGFKQRLSLACAIMHNPSVLFLDEPTSGVDVITRREFWHHITSLAKKGVSVLITTHFMDEAEFCDDISLFYQGKTIAADKPQELKKSTKCQTLEDAFIKIILDQKRRD